MACWTPPGERSKARRATDRGKICKSRATRIRFRATSFSRNEIPILPSAQCILIELDWKFPIPYNGQQTENSRRWRVYAAMVGVLALFVAASAPLSSHRAPWKDVGIYADSSSNLALRGQFGSTRWQPYLPGLVPDLPAIGQYTYWSTPLYLVSLAGIFRSVGFSILVIRAWSIWWSSVLIVSWYFIALSL